MLGKRRSAAPADARGVDWAGLAQDLAVACAALGCRLEAVDRHGRSGSIRYPDGRRAQFNGTAFDINPLGAANIARDKDHCAQALRRAGLTAPEGRVLLAARRIAKLHAQGSLSRREETVYADVAAAVRAVGLPAVIKPIDGMEGDGVARIGGVDRALEEAEALFARHDRLLLQPWLPGRDLRVVVLDGAVLFACERRRPSVVGDGRQVIAALIDRMAAERRRAGHPVGVSAADPAVRRYLGQTGRTLDTVPAAEERVELLPTANLSKGGDMADVTGKVHPEYARICRQGAEAIGLRFAGVDLLVATVERFDPGYTILELNAAPGLSHAGRLIGRERLQDLYRRVIAAMGSPRP